MIHPSSVEKETCSCAEVSPASIRAAMVAHAAFMDIVTRVYSFPPHFCGSASAEVSHTAAMLPSASMPTGNIKGAVWALYGREARLHVASRVISTNLCLISKHVLCTPQWERLHGSVLASGSG